MLKKLENRILEIDILRFLCVVLMVIDHIMYDIKDLMPMIFPSFPTPGTISSSIVNFANDYWYSTGRIVTRYIVLFIFLALTGICCSFSKSNTKRGAKLLIVAYGITLFTYIAGYLTNNPDMMISFGILHCIGFTLLLIGFFEKLQLDKWGYLFIGIVMISVGIYTNSISTFVSYEGNNFFSLTFNQMIGINSCGSDCFSLLLFGGQAFIGVFLGKLLYKNKKSLFKFKYHNNPITFVGRHSLLVYVAHQIIIPIIMGLIILSCGFKLQF